MVRDFHITHLWELQSQTEIELYQHVAFNNTVQGLGHFEAK